jgi:hypothetical protein
MVFRPDPRLVQHLSARIPRCLEECPDSGPVGCREREMRLTEAVPGRRIPT